MTDFDQRPHTAYAVAVMVIAVLLLVMLGLLGMLWFVLHSIAGMP